MQDLTQELNWLRTVLEQRFRTYFGYTNAEGEQVSPETLSAPDYPSPPDLTGMSTPYAALVQQHQLTKNDRLALVLALAPHLYPSILDCFFLKNQLYDRKFTEFGGFAPKHHTGFVPTAETLAFVLAGVSVNGRAEVYRMFKPEHIFNRQHLLSVGTVGADEPGLSGTLQISKHVLEQLGAEIHKSSATSDFPARHLTTEQTWDDLVLSDYLAQELEGIVQWQEHRNTLHQQWGMGRKLRPGYRVLFYGPPGTGKTMTASLIGQRLNRDVYRIDLSATTSKYIGETEKNLARIFDSAEHRNWILFFDEADALFSKRSQVSSSNDRHANQEVAYLLQRLETFDGLVLLATNLNENIDTAFMRRFEQSLYFAEPEPAEREKLWQQTKPKQVHWAEDIDIQAIAERHEMTGGMIINAMAYACIQILADQKKQQTNQPIISNTLLQQAIAREFYKVGKTI